MLQSFVPLTSMGMGAEVSRMLPTPSISQMRGEVTSFLHHFQLFYVEAAKQIKKRFPVDDPVIKSLIVLNPATVEIIKLAHKFTNIIAEESIQAVDDEWRELQFLNSVTICHNLQPVQDMMLCLSGPKSIPYVIHQAIKDLEANAVPTLFPSLEC